MTTPQPWTGQQISQKGNLPLAPNKPFWYMHHPNTCWEFLVHKNRWLFLPTFRQLFEMAGVNFVRLAKDGRGTDSSMARVKLMDDGFEILDLEMGYQTRHQTKSGGWYYSSIWEIPKISGNRVIWKLDKDGWNTWREDLMINGVLNYPDNDILSFMVDLQERRISRHEGKHLTPRIKKIYDFDVEKLRYMKQYIDTGKPVYVDGKAPKSKGKRNV